MRPVHLDFLDIETGLMVKFMIFSIWLMSDYAATLSSRSKDGEIDNEPLIYFIYSINDYPGIKRGF